MRNKILIILGVLVVMGAIAGGIVYANLDTAIKLASMAVNYIKYLNAPAGTTVTELAAGLQRRRHVGAARRPPRRVRRTAGAEDWASYNKHTDLGAFLAAQPDQYIERKHVKGFVHLRHRSIYRFQQRLDQGQRCPDFHDAIRYILD